jgi:hypothetical protein
MAHDTVRRALRTGAQAFLAALLVLLPTDLAQVSSQLLEVVWAAGWAAAVALVAFAHNELEDAGRLPDTRQPKARS